MMKKYKSIVAISLVVSLLMSCLFSAVAAPSTEDVLTADEKITSELKEQYAMSDGEEVLAQVWFSDIDMSVAETSALRETGITRAELNNYETMDSSVTMDPIVKGQNDEIQAYIEAKRAAATELYTEHNQNLTNELLGEAEVFYVSRYSPVVLVMLSENSAMTLARHSEIKMISYWEINDAKDVDLSISRSSSTSISDLNTLTRVSSIHTSPNYGFTGRGVKIGVYEISSPDVSKFNHLNIQKVITRDNGSQVGKHASTVLDIVSRVAPNAEYYIAANQVVTNNMEVIEELLDCGVNIINASRSIGGDASCQYNTTEKWLDHIAYQHDVHFVIASGNSGGSSVEGGETGPSAGAMAYNLIAVGNLDTKGNFDYKDDIIDDTSSYYLGNRLAFKPDICAPGTDIYSPFYQKIIKGSSLSAPQVSGVIALMCEQRPALKTQQTVVKAILTAGVNYESPHRYTPSNSNYRKYGAGLLDCVGACYVVGGYRYTNSSIASGSTSKTHTFTVSNSDSRIRVSLAFNVKSVASGTDHGTTTTSSLPNLNIQVKDPNGKVVGSSTTTNNNVEIVDFVPAATGKYSIVVTRVDKLPETVYYGLAWR